MSFMHGSEVRGRNEVAGTREGLGSFNPDARIERPREEAGRSASAFSPDKRVEVYDGGRYGDVFEGGRGDRIEVNHIPPFEVNGLSFRDGPTISMDKADHRIMSSTGNSKEARAHRAKQGELIEAGDFKGAVKMDIDDIRNKCGDKYDNALHKMLDYMEEQGYISNQKGLME